MSHKHPIYDDDKIFSISGVSRIITAPKDNLPVLAQYDHNSEHVTFECDRFVEGHDLLLSNKVEVHYTNMSGRFSSRGVYPVEDLRMHDADKSKITFTWIISEHATRYVGPIRFAITFTCLDVADITYRWSTLVNEDLTVSECIDNGEAVEGTYADVLEMWKQDLFGIGDTEEASMLRVSLEQQEAIANKGIETIASIPNSYPDLYSNVEDLNTLLGTTLETSNLYKANEFDDGGYYRHTDGSYTNEMSEYGSSGFIEVKENIQYYRKSSGYVTFWDANKGFISGSAAGQPGFVTPSGCKYVNCAIHKDLKYSFVLVEFGDVDYKIIHSKIDPINDYFYVETNNLYDSRYLGDGCYDLDGGFSYIDNYGSFTIPVSEGESYVKSRSGYISYFNSANIWMSATIIGANTTFVVPKDAVKMNVAVLLTDTEFWLVHAGETYYKKLVSDYLPDSLNGMRYGALGDSITDGYEAPTCYGDILAENEKLAFTNYGISGNRIADSDDENNDPMYVRYANMNNDLDIITVFGGTNDYASQTPIGENQDLTGSTFKGALNILCRGLLSKYVGKRIGFMTPIHRRVENLATPLVDYVNAIKEICGIYGIPVLDLYNTSTITCANDDNSYGLLSDGLHPSEAGHEVLARKISSFIKTL